MKHKVLVVDDDWAFLELLKLVLETHGYDVALAQSGWQFRQKIQQEIPPDLIILDIVLGRDDGVQLYEELLHEGLDRKVPVLFISGLAKDIAATPPAAGRSYALVPKPFEVDRLVKQISVLVN